MKISGIRKILIICLSLVIALATALFATQLLTRDSYALVSPDGLSAYDDEGPKIPDTGAIAPPQPDIDPDEPAWEITFQQITVGIDVLTLRVEGWYENDLSTTAKINGNPDGIYNSDPELVVKIESLLKSDGFILYEIQDVDGNEVTDITQSAPGTTLFIIVKVNEKCADFVNITYADGVQRSYSWTVPYPENESMTPVPRISPVEYTLYYEGVELNLQQVVDKVLAGDAAGYLRLVEAHSDALKQNSIGDYILTFCFKPGVKRYWQGTNRDMSAVEVTVHVLPLEIDVITSIDKEYYYTGYDIDVSSIITEMYKDYVIVVSGVTKAKDAANYEFKLAINPKYGDSIKWKDGVTGEITVTWSIKKLLISGEWDSMGDYGRITVKSEIEGVDFSLQADDIEYTYTNTATGEKKNTLGPEDVGQEFTVEVTLKNENLEWAEDPGSHTFTLTKELIELPKPVISFAKSEYTGFAITFEVTIGGVSIFDPQFADYIEVVEGLSDSLTQTEVGKYKVVIRLKHDSVCWPGNLTGDVVIEFEITKVIIDIQWTFFEDLGFSWPSFNSSYLGSDYIDNIVKISYIDVLTGVEVTRSEMKAGKSYRIQVTLLKEDSFEFKAGAETYKDFTLKAEFIAITVPELSSSSLDYTGEKITFTVLNQAQLEEYIAKGYITMDGSFEVTNAGTYTVTLTIKNPTYIWNAGEGDVVTLTFTVNKAVLTGEWGEDGKMKFTSSFKGNYNDVVEYVYYDSEGNVVAYEDLVSGQTYTVTVRLREGMEMNFDDSQLEKSWTFVFSNGKSSFPWWIFLIIAFVLIIIIIIIIIVVKRRNKDDEYDDFYGDEYYGDEEGEGEGEEGDFGDMDEGDGDFGGEEGEEGEGEGEEGAY